MSRRKHNFNDTYDADEFRPAILEAVKKIRSAQSHKDEANNIIFCREYAFTGDIDKAANAAGWKYQKQLRGKKLLAQTLYLDLINAYREEFIAEQDRIAINAGKNIGNILADHTRTDKLTLEEKQMILSVFVRFGMSTKNANDIRNALTAISELNKMDGDLAPTKIDGKMTHEHFYAEASDAELDEAIRAFEKQLGIVRH